MKKYRWKAGILLGVLCLYLVSLIVVKAGAADSPEYKIPGIEEVGIAFSDFTVPADVKVIGIGEATHGNREFQMAKLWMLQKLVDTGRCHAIAFEMSPGEAADYNDAIRRADSDLTELLSRTNYPIYDTQEMEDLLSWMREYNLSHTESESLIFYGVDMQGDERELDYLSRFCREYPDLFTEEELEQLTILAEDVKSEEPQIDKETEYTVVAELKEKLLLEEAKRSGYETIRFSIASACAGAVLQWIDSPSFDENANEYGQYRDDRMAENLQAFYELENKRGYSQILITAHNGHSMKGDAQGYGDYTMGNKINELFGGSYYTIGTEFYHSCVNIHTSGTYDEQYEREDHEYCSEDPLAYQAKDWKDGIYCLDVASVTDESSRIYKLLHNPCFTGCAGEGYNAYMDIYRTYRSKIVVADHYDAMIYFYETTPIVSRSY